VAGAEGEGMVLMEGELRKGLKGTKRRNWGQVNERPVFNTGTPGVAEYPVSQRSRIREGGLITG